MKNPREIRGDFDISFNLSYYSFHFIFHFIFIYFDRVKLQIYIHKLLYKLPCTKKKDKTSKDLQYTR